MEHDVELSEKALEKVIQTLFKAPEAYDYGCESVAWHCQYEQDKWECRDCQLSQLVC
jgi:hypothetical protein